MTGNLNLCPSDTTWNSAHGLCNSEGVFGSTADVSKEGGKVLIHSTSEAGGITTGATDSKYLMKACVTNGGTVPTSAGVGEAGANLNNML